MAKKNGKPVFAKRIFWDVDLDHLDIDMQAAFVIQRVFERGDVDDIRQCRRYYGDEKIKEVLLASKYLPDHRLHLASAVIDVPIQLFRCYTLKQSNPGLSPY